MTCLEAQSKIIAYIDYNLDKDQKTDFLKHIQCCEDCKEELNIYYTMIEGMRQLDSNLSLSEDFGEELNRRIEYELKQNKKKKSFLRSSVFLAVAGMLSFLIIAYINFLNLLYEDEQAKLKAAQGEYYYSQTFGGILFEPEEEEYILNDENKEKVKSFYEKIREYNVMNSLR